MDGEEEDEAGMLPEEESGEASMQMKQQPLCHDSFKVHQITDQVFICQEHLIMDKLHQIERVREAVVEDSEKEKADEKIMNDEKMSEDED